MRRICAGLADGVAVAMLAMASSALAATEPSDAREPSWSATGLAGVVVNDVAPSGFGGSTDEYVELRNTSGELVVLDGWELAVCMSGSSPSILAVFGSSDFIAPGGHLLLAGSGYSGAQPPDFRYTVDVPDDGGWLLSEPFSGSDGVGLDGTLTCTEGSPATECDWDSGESASRGEDGTDTDDNLADFTCQPGTPGF